MPNPNSNKSSNNKNWSVVDGVAQITSPAVTEVVTPMPKSKLESVIARYTEKITRKTARIAEMQAEVDELTTDKAAMEAVLAGVTGDPA